MSIEKIEYDTYTCDLCEYQSDVQKAQLFSGWVNITREVDDQQMPDDKYHICIYCKHSFGEWLDERRKVNND